MPCGGIIGTRLPVEYILNGIAFGLVKGFVEGDGGGIAKDMSATPTELMRPPSVEKMRFTSNPGVLVGMPLKSRQEIWSSVIDGSGVGVGEGGRAWFA